MAVSPDGRTMALGYRDGSVRFVNLRTGDVTLGTGGHTAGVVSVGFTPSSDVVTTGDDGQVLIWDVASHEVIETFAGHGGSVVAQATIAPALEPITSVPDLWRSRTRWSNPVATSASRNRRGEPPVSTMRPPKTSIMLRIGSPASSSPPRCVTRAANLPRTRVCCVAICSRAS